MNAVESFAAARRDRMREADADLAPLVVSALTAWTEDGPWYEELVEAASVLWMEVFEQEAPRADPEVFIGRYQDMAREALSATERPENPPTAAQVRRVTYWLSTATVNNATYFGNRAHGGSGMRWVTMMDESVRATHRAANGQIADSDGTFDIGGYDLHYPGEPVGPPEIWINCRCVLASARVEGALDVTDALTADMAGVIADEDEAVEEVPEDEDLLADEPEDDEEIITEIPVHGVATVEGRPTGDGRHFLRDSVEYGQLPQPLGFEFESSHSGDNSRVAVIGRIDEYWKVDNGEYVEVRWRGVVHPGKPYAAQAIEGIIDGSYGGLSIIADDISVDVESSTLNAETAPDGTQPVVDVNHLRIRRHDMVPTPAYQEAYIALGAEFPDELDDEELEALKACGCDMVESEQDAYRDVSPDERKKLADEGKALPDGSFPIANEEDLRNAIQAIGRASDPEEAKRHIKKRARELGKEDLIPEDWSVLSELTAASGSFAPGTKDGVRKGGDVDNMEAWRNRTAGPLPSSTTDPTTTSAGRGPVTSTGAATAESPRTATGASVPHTASSTSGASDPSRMGSSSTTPATTDQDALEAARASIADASTRGISNLSRTPSTSLADRLTMAPASSAGLGFTTSPAPTAGTSGSKTEWSGALAASAGSPTVGATKSERLSADIESASVAFAPGTRDGPGWITHPIPTARIRRYWVRGKGAAKIRWGMPGDFNRCRRQLAKYIQNPDWLAGACANLHKEALGVWPGQESGRRAHSTEGVAMTLTAAAPALKPAAAFKDPGLTGPTPFTVDLETGAVFGHLATWGVCHIGIQDVCTVAPHSSTDYAFFRTGAVMTDEGRIPVGQITMGTGHASIKANAKSAVAHYDNTGTVVADVAAGEDAHGIWVAGLLRPGVTEDQAHALMAAALSGDWRRTAAGLELVAALAVNVPGFPVPRTSLSASAVEGQESLVAAGILAHDEALTAGLLPSADEIAGIVRTAIQEYRHQENIEARVASLAPFARKTREHVMSKINDYFKED